MGAQSIAIIASGSKIVYFVYICVEKYHFKGGVPKLFRDRATCEHWEHSRKCN